jgi:hypothetical protein
MKTPYYPATKFPNWKPPPRKKKNTGPKTMGIGFGFSLSDNDLTKYRKGNAPS